MRSTTASHPEVIGGKLLDFVTPTNINYRFGN
jgi:hypothetical protein